MRILVNKKFPMLLLHWWLDCQNDAGNKSFRRMNQKKAVSGEIRSFQFGVQALFKRRSGIFILNIEHILHLILVFLLLNLNK